MEPQYACKYVKTINKKKHTHTMNTIRYVEGSEKGTLRSNTKIPAKLTDLRVLVDPPVVSHLRLEYPVQVDDMLFVQHTTYEDVKVIAVPPNTLRVTRVTGTPSYYTVTGVNVAAGITLLQAPVTDYVLVFGTRTVPVTSVSNSSGTIVATPSDSKCGEGTGWLCRRAVRWSQLRDQVLSTGGGSSGITDIQFPESVRQYTNLNVPNTYGSSAAWAAHVLPLLGHRWVVPDDCTVTTGGCVTSFAAGTPIWPGYVVSKIANLGWNNSTGLFSTKDGSPISFSAPWIAAVCGFVCLYSESGVSDVSRPGLEWGWSTLQSATTSVGTDTLLNVMFNAGTSASVSVQSQSLTGAFGATLPTGVYKLTNTLNNAVMYRHTSEPAESNVPYAVTPVLCAAVPQCVLTYGCPPSIRGIRQECSGIQAIYTLDALVNDTRMEVQLDEDYITTALAVVWVYYGGAVDVKYTGTQIIPNSRHGTVNLVLQPRRRACDDIPVDIRWVGEFKHSLNEQ